MNLFLITYKTYDTGEEFSKFMTGKYESDIIKNLQNSFNGVKMIVIRVSQLTY
jgi:hypothetical protein